MICARDAKNQLLIGVVVFHIVIVYNRLIDSFGAIIYLLINRKKLNFEYITIKTKSNFFYNI